MTSESIYITAVLHPKPGKVDEIIAAVRETTKTVQEKEPGVFIYFAFRSKGADGEDEIVVVEKYKDDDAKEAHIQSEHMQKLFNQLQDLLDKPLEIKEGSFISGFEHR